MLCRGTKPVQPAHGTNTADAGSQWPRGGMVDATDLKTVFFACDDPPRSAELHVETVIYAERGRRTIPCGVSARSQLGAARLLRVYALLSHDGVGCGNEGGKEERKRAWRNW